MSLLGILQRRSLAAAAQDARRLSALLVLAPAVVAILVLVIWPAAQVIWLSFFKLRLAQVARGITVSPTLANYQEILVDPVFHNAIGVTFFFVVATTGISFLVGLAGALALNQSFPGNRVVRALTLSPWAVAPVIASLVWMFLLDRNYGLINYAAHVLGLIDKPIDWLNGPTEALISIVVVSVWKSFPFFMIMLLAALQSVPGHLHDAARLDGAGTWGRYQLVTWPSLRGTAGIAMLFSALSSFREVETILVLTQGGPARSTETIAVQAYVEAFEYYDVGGAAALGALGLLSIVTIAVLVGLVRWSMSR